MPTRNYNCDVLVIGSGVIGLSIGLAILQAKPNLKVIVTEKERSSFLHASGRNSGVLHAGFYYSPDSLKAKFCRDGNFEIRKLAKSHDLRIREVGKVVVARNDEENLRLDSLFERGIKNNVDLELLDVSKLNKIEPLAITQERFLWSPMTAVADPKALVMALSTDFQSLGGVIHYDTKIALTIAKGEIRDKFNCYDSKIIVNAAGAQADRISREVGVGLNYAMLPFMGIYRATAESNLPLQRLVYPVPHPVNPFLGVHFTLTTDHKVKIGPTAIPIGGREQYSYLSGWSGPDIIQAIKGIRSLVSGETHDFGALLKTEWPKIWQKCLVHESTQLVPSASKVTKWSRKPPGIRAQLVHLSTGKLEQDFVVKSHQNSVHILNAVSPGWTSSIPFGRWVATQHVLPHL